jgi:UDP-glucose 4-epimerase
MSASSWIIGSGGLLGSHLTTAASAEGHAHFDPRTQFAWHNLEKAKLQIADAIAAFFNQRPADQRWRIYWAAGNALVAAPVAALNQEFALWNHFLSCLALKMEAERSEGTLFLASSAGAIYGNSAECLTETSPLTPISDYGKHKIRMEQALEHWIAKQLSVRGLIGRISNLYGESDNIIHSRSLIAHTSRCILTHRPIQIIVPLDTIRDYIHADDCAEDILRCIDLLDHSDHAGVTLKIFASERTTTIAQIIGTFGRVAHTQPRIVCSTIPDPRHVRQVRFRSEILPSDPHRRLIGLAEGIIRVHACQQQLLAEGKMK